MKLSLYRAHRSKKLKDSGLNFREPDKIFLKENHQMCRFSANLCSYKIFLKKNYMHLEIVCAPVKNFSRFPMHTWRDFSEKNIFLKICNRCLCPCRRQVPQILINYPSKFTVEFFLRNKCIHVYLKSRGFWAKWMCASRSSEIWDFRFFQRFLVIFGFSLALNV